MMWKETKIKRLAFKLQLWLIKKLVGNRSIIMNSIVVGHWRTIGPPHMAIGISNIFIHEEIDDLDEKIAKSLPRPRVTIHEFPILEVI